MFCTLSTGKVINLSNISFVDSDDDRVLSKANEDEEYEEDESNEYYENENENEDEHATIDLDYFHDRFVGLAGLPTATPPPPVIPFIPGPPQRPPAVRQTLQRPVTLRWYIIYFNVVNSNDTLRISETEYEELLVKLKLYNQMKYNLPIITHKSTDEEGV